MKEDYKTTTTNRIEASLNPVDDQVAPLKDAARPERRQGERRLGAERRDQNSPGANNPDRHNPNRRTAGRRASDKGKDTKA
ncbi:MAG: hypothetical protein ABI284_08295 [Nitrosospira sp.]